MFISSRASSLNNIMKVCQILSEDRKLTPVKIYIRKSTTTTIAFFLSNYRLIRNSNGLTTIRLICHNTEQNQDQQQPMEEYSDDQDVKLENQSAATDLRKME